MKAPFAPHSSLCLKLHLSISHVSMTSQLRPPGVHWKPDNDITPEFANEIWSGIESIEPHCARQQEPCSVLKDQLFFIPLAPLLPFSSPRFKLSLGGCRHTDTFGTTCSRHQTGRLGADDPGFERQACQTAIIGEMR